MIVTSQQQPRFPSHRIAELLDQNGVVLVLQLGRIFPPPETYRSVRELVGREWLRFQALRSASAQASFLARCWLVRRCLADALRCAVSDIDIEVAPTGRPRLRNRGQLDFNLSHTSGALLVGLSTSGDIGVDIESAGRDLSSVVPSLCSPVERARLGAMPSQSRGEHLVRLWTLKEAVAKNVGLGLALGFTGFGLDLAGDRAALTGPNDRSLIAPLWDLSSFHVPGGFLAAIAQRHCTPTAH
jgi:4'-phosphopantetheinyl transferase